MMRFRHVHVSTTFAAQTEFAGQAVKELRLGRLAGKPLHPVIAEDLMRRVEELASELEREAEMAAEEERREEERRRE